MRAVAGYGVAGAVLLGLVVLALRPLLGPEATRAVGWMAGLAWVVQLVAFTLLWAGRRRTALFLAAWSGGTLGRLVLMGGVGLWIWKSRALPAVPALLGLAGSLFALLLLEPAFFRVRRQEQ